MVIIAQRTLHTPSKIPVVDVFIFYVPCTFQDLHRFSNPNESPRGPIQHSKEQNYESQSPYSTRAFPDPQS